MIYWNEGDNLFGIGIIYLVRISIISYVRYDFLKGRRQSIWKRDNFGDDDFVLYDEYG